MTMSWVADRIAIATATMAVAPGSIRGSVKPSARIASASGTWTASAQPRRRPSRRVSGPSSSRSTSGAQRNFSE